MHHWELYRRSPVALATLAVIAMGLFPDVGGAAWPTDPSVNLPICASTGTVVGPSILPDARGGAVIVWYGSTANAAQRVNGNGQVQWALNGIPIGGFSIHPYIVPDGRGGFIIAGTQVLKRVDGGGGSPWGAGVAVSTNGVLPVHAPDGRGGAIFAWVSATDPGTFIQSVMVQRLDHDGIPKWSSGVALSSILFEQADIQAVVPVEDGGAIVVWRSNRILGPGLAGMYARRVGPDGTPQWADNGVRVFSLSNEGVLGVSDGAGGAVLARQISAGGNIYTRHVDPAGVPRGPADGVLVRASGSISWMRLVSDGEGGAIVAWSEPVSLSITHAFAQRVNDTGIEWTPVSGVGLCSNPTSQIYPDMVADRAGGAIIVWQDSRHSSIDLYAQRLNAAGQLLWSPDATPICTHSGDQTFPVIASVGVGGAIVAWQDAREPGGSIYAQGVGPDGALQNVDVGEPGSFPRIGLSVAPNPARGSLLFLPPSGWGSGSIEVLDLEGRRLWSAPMTQYGVRWSGVTTVGEHVPSGVYVARINSGTRAESRRFVWIR